MKSSCWYASKMGMVKQIIEYEDGKMILELERIDRNFDKKVPLPKP